MRRRSGEGSHYSPLPSSSNTNSPRSHGDDHLSPNTASLVGTCPDMCPAKERAQRERLRDLSVFERVDGDPKRTSPDLAVKKFCRTISTLDVEPSDMRPLPVLQKTLDYLLSLLDSSPHPFEIVRDFVFDRTRSIRQDLTMQNIVNDQAIHMYEEMVKFHITSHRKLASCCSKPDVSSLCYLNMEQLMKCLLTLFDLYRINRKSVKKNEAEFHSFYVLLHLGCKIPKMGESLSLWYRQLSPSILCSEQMRFARTLLRYSQLGNFKHFFALLASEATDLQLCLAAPFLNEVACTGNIVHQLCGLQTPTLSVDTPFKDPNDQGVRSRNSMHRVWVALKQARTSQVRNSYQLKTGILLCAQSRLSNF